MTDTEAIAQVNAMRSEALSVKAEVVGAHSDVSNAITALETSLDSVEARLALMSYRVQYALNNFGA